MDDEVIITLKCKHCENTDCDIWKDGVYIFGKEGCTRVVSEEVAAHYQHYTQEIIPFWKHYSWENVKESYTEILVFLETQVYSAPLGHKLNRQGKAVQ